MTLNIEDIATAKGMLKRGDKHHEIAAFFGVNPGRIAEIKAGQLGPSIKPADPNAIPPIVPQRQGRFIDPNASLETQIQQLKAFISQPPADSRRLKITPELAEWILQNLNGRNRPRRQRDIRRYAEDMSKGNWWLTGDTIKFNRHGFLADGQHRLSACVRAQSAFESYVVFGVGPEAFAVMDTGRKRNSDDTFAVAGVPNANVASAAVRWVNILTSAKPTDRGATYTNTELLNSYNDLDTALMDSCVRKAIGVCKGRRYLNSGSMAALLYLFSLDSQDAADTLYQEMAQFTRNGRKLFDRLEAIAKQNLGRMHENQRNALTVLAYRAARSGRVILADALAWNQADPFPSIR